MVDPPSPVRLARPEDLNFIVDLQDRNCQALGFIMRVALENKIKQRAILIGEENADNAGFLHYGSLRRPEVRIFQACVAYDARRRQLGSALLRRFEADVLQAGGRAISLRCREGLDANEFWQAEGFARLTVEPGRKGPLNVWGKILAPGEFTFHCRQHPCPKCGRLTTDTWTRGAKRWSVCQECLWIP